MGARKVRLFGRCPLWKRAPFYRKVRWQWAGFDQSLDILMWDRFLGAWQNVRYSAAVVVPKIFVFVPFCLVILTGSIASHPIDWNVFKVLQSIASSIVRQILCIKNETISRGCRGQSLSHTRLTIKLVLTPFSIIKVQFANTFIFRNFSVKLDEINQLFLPNMRNKLLWFYQEVNEPEPAVVPEQPKPGPSRTTVSNNSKTPQGTLCFNNKFENRRPFSNV